MPNSGLVIDTHFFGRHAVLEKYIPYFIPIRYGGGFQFSSIEMDVLIKTCASKFNEKNYSTSRLEITLMLYSIFSDDSQLPGMVRGM